MGQQTNKFSVYSRTNSGIFLRWVGVDADLPEYRSQSEIARAERVKEIINFGRAKIRAVGERPTKGLLPDLINFSRRKYFCSFSVANDLAEICLDILTIEWDRGLFSND